MIDLITSSFHFFRINVFNGNSPKWIILKKFCVFCKKVEEFEEIVPKDQCELFLPKMEKEKSCWSHNEKDEIYQSFSTFWSYCFFKVSIENQQKITFSLFWESLKKEGVSSIFALNKNPQNASIWRKFHEFRVFWSSSREFCTLRRFSEKL